MLLFKFNGVVVIVVVVRGGRVAQQLTSLMNDQQPGRAALLPALYVSPEPMSEG